MRQDLTDITIVLDRSGSMQSVASDTIGGFNKYLADQQAAPGEASMTLVQFDHEYEFVHKAKGIKDIPPLTSETFVPRGNTALLDAIGRTIIDTGARLGQIDEAKRPGVVIFVIITDGMENASREFTRDKVFEQIKHQTENYKWNFIFLGANQDAIAVGASYGVSGAASMTYASNPRGTKAAFAALSASNARTRSGGINTFTQKDRDDQTSAGVK